MNDLRNHGLLQLPTLCSAKPAPKLFNYGFAVGSVSMLWLKLSREAGMQLYHAEACSPCSPSLHSSAVLGIPHPCWEPPGECSGMQPAPEHQETTPLPSPAASQGHRESGVGGKPEESTPKRSDGSCAEMGAAMCGSEMVFWNCKLKYI